MLTKSAVTTPVEVPTGLLAVPGSRRGLAGFFVSGLLFAFLGAIMPSWGHHLLGDYNIVGLHFFCAAAGVVLAQRLAGSLLPRKGTGFVLITACLIATGALLYLAAVSPPAPSWTRLFGVTFIGVAGGLLNAAIFPAIGSIYRHDPVATANLGGTLFGLGCLTSALLISGVFYVYTVPSILILLAVIPGLFAILYSKVRYPNDLVEPNRPIRELLNDLRSPVAVLFALLLFFQFGNEWAIAGWLPLFLVQRLGISPAKALLLVSVYWLALLVGRIAAQSLVEHIRHSVLLMGSTFAAMFGCLVLAFTNNRFGATTGIILVGGGFASIYPLVAEQISARFPNYHSGLYNGIFSVAMFGALLAPCTMGFVAALSDIQVVMLVPVFGSIMVLLLLVAIWVDSRLTVQGIKSESSPAGPS
jgi:FHS family glucose/mannose:H+ symporter-like MFS transporter